MQVDSEINETLSITANCYEMYGGPVGDPQSREKAAAIRKHLADNVTASRKAATGRNYPISKTCCICKRAIQYCEPGSKSEPPIMTLTCLHCFHVPCCVMLLTRSKKDVKLCPVPGCCTDMLTATSVQNAVLRRQCSEQLHAKNASGSDSDSEFSMSEDEYE